MQQIVSDLRKAAERRFTESWEVPARFGPPASDDEISELEGMIHGKLPEEYGSFLRVTRRIQTSDVSVFSPFAISGIFRSPEIPVRLVTGLPDHPVEDDVFPVAGDGGGNVYLLGSRGPTAGAVWYWSHEGEEPLHGSASEGFELQASSFGAFLRSIALRWNEESR